MKELEKLKEDIGRCYNEILPEYNLSTPAPEPYGQDEKSIIFREWNERIVHHITA